MQYTRSEAKAWAQANLNGFHHAPLTPFTRDGDVDLPALRYNGDAFAGMSMDIFREKVVMGAPPPHPHPQSPQPQPLPPTPIPNP